MAAVFIAAAAFLLTTFARAAAITALLMTAVALRFEFCRVFFFAAASTAAFFLAVYFAVRAAPALLVTMNASVSGMLQHTPALLAIIFMPLYNCLLSVFFWEHFRLRYHHSSRQLRLEHVVVQLGSFFRGAKLSFVRAFGSSSPLPYTPLI